LVAVGLERGARRALSRKDAGARRGPFLLGRAPTLLRARRPPDVRTGSKTSTGALDRGGRGRTSGYRGAWPTTNTGAPCGGPDFEGSLDARDALGRRTISAGARPGRQGGGTAGGARG
jgi:hypothetical protein